MDVFLDRMASFFCDKDCKFEPMAMDWSLG